MEKLIVCFSGENYIFVGTIDGPFIGKIKRHSEVQSLQIFNYNPMDKHIVMNFSNNKDSLFKKSDGEVNKDYEIDFDREEDLDMCYVERAYFEVKPDHGILLESDGGFRLLKSKDEVCKIVNFLL
jgi:hypothetical protein